MGYEQQEGKCIFYVKDADCGIPEEKQGQIF